MTPSPAKASPTLERLLAAAQLPALPQSAIRVLEISRDARHGPAELAVPIEADPGLMGQVLKFVNSSYFGFAREIASVKLAITLVGCRAIKNFVLWNAVFSLLPNPKCGPFDLQSLWHDSLRRGLLSRALGKRCRLKEAEDLFAAALLQDMALPLLASAMPREYAELLEQRDGGRDRLSVLEQERFGWTHAEAGALLAARWNLPAEFAEAMKHHASDDSLATVDPAALGRAIVALSALLPALHDDGWHEAAALEAAYLAICSDGAPLVDLLAQVDAEFAEFAPVLKVSTASATLAERWRAAQVVSAG